MLLKRAHACGFWLKTNQRRAGACHRPVFRPPFNIDSLTVHEVGSYSHLKRINIVTSDTAGHRTDQRPTGRIVTVHEVNDLTRRRRCRTRIAMFQGQRHSEKPVEALRWRISFVPMSLTARWKTFVSKIPARPRKLMPSPQLMRPMAGIFARTGVAALSRRQLKADSSGDLA